MEECHKILTDQIDWTNPEGDQVRIDINRPLPLSGPPSYVTVQTQFFFNHDLDYLQYGSKGSGQALSISKIKAARYHDFGLELLVPEHMRIDDVCTYDISSLLCVVRIKAYSCYGYDYLKEITLRRADHQEYTIAEKDFKNLYPSDFEDLNLLLLQGHLNHLPGSDIRMLSTAKQLNLTKPGWDATGFEFKHDYTIIDLPRAVVFPVSNNEWKIMRFNEIYKFSDGTLTNIMEALDYRVKEYKVNRLNPGMNTRFWTHKDVERSKEFTHAIEQRLKTRRIFWNLECFVGGRVAVRSSLRSLKPKRTIESRAKRSSINLIRTLFHITCSSHNVKTRIIIRVLRIILVVLPEHPSYTYVFTMKMEILLEPTSSKLMVGDSDVHTLEDPTLILEILSRRFFLRLNLPDHRFNICFKASTTLISKSSRSDHVLKFKELQERRLIKLSPSRKRFGILCSIVRSGLVYCSGGLSRKYTVLAVCQIVHCASGLSLTSVCLIRQRFVSSGLSSSVALVMGELKTKLGTLIQVKQGRFDCIVGVKRIGPERARVYSDLSPEDKDRYNADIRATNILLQGLPKGICTLINHYIEAKDIWDNVKMLPSTTHNHLPLHHPNIFNHTMLALHTPKKRSTTDQFILQRHTLTTEEATRPSAQPLDDTSANIIYDSPSPADAGISARSDKTSSGGDTKIVQSTKELGEDVKKQENVKEKMVELDQDQDGSDPGKTLESRPQPEQVHMEEDQAGPDHGISRVALAGPDPEPTHDEFMADLYPKVQESLKFPADEHVILEDPLSSTGTLSSMKNLEDAYAIRDQFINDNSSNDELGKLNVEAKVVFMVTVLIYQASSSVPPLSTPVIDLSPPKPASYTTQTPIFTATTTTTTTPLPPPPQQQSTTESELAKRIAALEKKLSYLEQTNKNLDNTTQNLGSRVYTLELRDLPHKINKAQPIDDIAIQDSDNISDSEDADSAHLLKTKQRPYWLKPIPDDERPATPEPT
ncbi:hypothetical protein Tco_1004328 [Tanacetum coccineum]|uniref:Uncharacterized protein n=1 Tax=Tanacetum coccineum TaxID=301880 RepID=A0ABQ5FCY1_9ASTR